MTLDSDVAAALIIGLFFLGWGLLMRRLESTTLSYDELPRIQPDKLPRWLQAMLRPWSDDDRERARDAWMRRTAPTTVGSIGLLCIAFAVFKAIVR
jgi:hypothetical protein